MERRDKLAYTASMVDVRLLPIDPSLAESLRAGPERFEQLYSVNVATDAPIVRDVVEKTLEMLAPDSHDARWGGYLAVDESRDIVVGSCAFKGPPTQDGTVEIAYYTFGPYEGRGYAKSMARALISVAHTARETRRVIAHTLPESNPSTSVLRSVGMSFAGEVRDPDDGLVWRWQLEPSVQGHRA